jgi:hypothetical protein
MGLDQIAYAKKGDKEADLMTWRKHSNLQGFMEQVWEDNDRPVPDDYGDLAGLGVGVADEFNCIALSLTLGNIEDLEECVNGNTLPETSGFFFGQSEEWHKDKDKEFIVLAKKYLLDGYDVYYDSWW